jgi:hypothetical protein
MFYDFLMTAPPAQMLGLFGAGLQICMYALITLHVLRPGDWPFCVLNIAAAGLIANSLTVDFNPASAVTQTFWISVGLLSLLSRAIRLWQNRVRPIPDRLRPLA